MHDLDFYLCFAFPSVKQAGLFIYVSLEENRNTFQILQYPMRIDSLLFYEKNTKVPQSPIISQP